MQNSCVTDLVTLHYASKLNIFLRNGRTLRKTLVGLAVRFRFEAKIRETEAKFFSLRSEEKGKFRFEAKRKVYMRNESLNSKETGKGSGRNVYSYAEHVGMK